jgi:hypothetical protein
MYNTDHQIQSEIAGMNTIKTITPQSPKNVASTSITSVTANENKGLFPYGTISTASGTKSFDFSQFYFACVGSSGQAAAGIAVSCTISVSGYKKDGSQVPQMSETFAPLSLTGPNPMRLAVVPSSYRSLINVTLALSGVDAATTTLYIDDVQHCNYT